MWISKSLFVLLVFQFEFIPTCFLWCIHKVFFCFGVYFNVFKKCCVCFCVFSPCFVCVGVLRLFCVGFVRLYVIVVVLVCIPMFSDRFVFAVYSDCLVYLFNAFILFRMFFCVFIGLHAVFVQMGCIIFVQQCVFKYC